MAWVVAQEVPSSSAMAVPHGPAGVGAARRRVREELRAAGAAETVVDDAVLILSELLSNSCRHARPLSADRCIRAAWRRNSRGELTISVTDGGGPTRPLPATPSVSARGGRGLAIITALARDWGVDEEVREFAGGAADNGPDAGEESKGVTVWAVLAPADGHSEGDVRVNGAGRSNGRVNGRINGSRTAGAAGAGLSFDMATVEDLDLR